MRKFKLDKKGIIAVLSVVLAILLSVAAFKNQPKNITYDDYEKLLDAGLIGSAVLEDGKIMLTSRGGAKYVIVKDAVDITTLAKKIIVEVDNSSGAASGFLSGFFILIALLSGVLFYKKFKKGCAPSQPNQAGESVTADIGGMLASGAVFPAISNVRFSDVAGIGDVKFELSEIVDFLKNPAKYKKFGIKMPKGVLMIGPPGVGKTLVAKAVAGEANVPFFYQSGASFVQIYVGMGAKRVRELFLKAKAYAPSIIFIDEIDAVGKVRGGNRNDEREATLNQLLTEMDGFEDNSGVIVIAATNRIEMIDEALLRSGRFDRRIFLSMPDFADRVEILKTYLSGKNTDVDIDEIAKISVGFSGAALATLVNEAAIHALRKSKETIELSDFENVLNNVLLGKKRTLSFNEEEKKIQALYQGAKALTAYWFGIEFEKISLLQDGFTTAERELESASSMLSRIKVYLAGMAALKILKNELFSNSGTDLAKAKDIADEMAFNYGMGDNFIATQTDSEEILRNAYAEVSAFLQGMKTQLEQIAEYIADNENIDKKTLENIVKNHYEKEKYEG